MVMGNNGDDISLVYDEINVHGPTTRYGLVDKTNSEFVLSNMLAEGFTAGYAPTLTDSILIVSSSTGTLSFRTIASLEKAEVNAPERSFIESLLEPLPGDETKALILIGVAVLISVIFLYLVVSPRSSKRRAEITLGTTAEVDDDSVDLMVDIEPDDAEFAINLDAEELVVQSPVAVMVEEEEETLSQSLEQADSSSGNSRLSEECRESDNES